MATSVETVDTHESMQPPPTRLAKKWSALPFREKCVARADHSVAVIRRGDRIEGSRPMVFVTFPGQVEAKRSAFGGAPEGGEVRGR